MKHYRIVASCACALALLMWMLCVSSARAADRTYHFDIPAEALSQALRAFGETAGEQIIFTEDLVSGVTFSGLRGDFSAEAALQRLLQGTGLVAERSPTGVIMIRRTARSTKAADQSTSPITAQSSADTVRLAHLDQGRTPNPSTVEKQEEQSSKKTPVQLEEVIVTGSRIPLATKDTAQEVRIYTSEQIERSGQGTVADFFSTLPEVSVNSIDGPLSEQGKHYADQTTVTLHGLPTGTTLVLLNGRRVEINNYGYFDLNNIPLFAIDRIEVLPVGASAIYGADSLAGTVNIILKKDFQGSEANAKYGWADGTAEKDVNIGVGKHWQQADLSFIGSYQHRGELENTDRSVASHPTFNSLAFLGGDLCFAGTVYSQNGANLPGLQSPEAQIPPGISGKPTVQQFAATSGQVNRCGFEQYWDSISPSDREGLLVTGHFQFTDSADVFSEVMVSHELVTSRVGNVLQFFNAFGNTLPATNPFNPFGETIGLSYTYPGQPYTYERATTFVRPLIGVRGALPGDWNYEVTGFLSYDRSQVDQNDPNNAAINAALASYDPATALNPFSAGPPGSPQLLDSLVTPHQLFFHSQNITGEGLVRGTLLTLPSGPLAAVFGIEYDRSTISTEASAIGISSPPFYGARDAYALFTEERIPLITGRRSISGEETLAINAAGRLDHSNDYGSKGTAQVGLEWRPLETVVIRGGYATSYEAPQLPQLDGAPTTFQTGGFVDPFRGNVPVTNVPEETGPNPNLKPETGVSRQVGIVYSSERVSGLRLSLTNWSIDVKNYIQQPNEQDLIDYPNLFPSAITRAPPSAQDIRKGFLGPIININDIYANFGDLNVAGVDLDALYDAHADFGELVLSAAITETYRYLSALSPSLAATSKVSQADVNGFAPRWKGTAGVTWKRDRYEASADGRYIGPYNDYLGTSFPYPHDVGNLWLFDARFRYAIGQALTRYQWFSGAYVSLGAVNLFNELPKSSYSPNGYDSQEGDIRGRFLYVELGAKW